MDSHLKDFSPPADPATSGHYSDSLSRKLEKILDNHEYSDVEDADTISVNSNLEGRLAKLLDDTEDDASSRAWSAASSSSSRSSTSTGHLSAIELEDSQFEFTSKEQIQPLGVELAAALDTSSHHSSDSEQTVEDEEEEEEDFYVHNKAVELLNQMQADGSATDVEISIAESDTSSEHSVDRQKKSSSAMYPSSSGSSRSDSDSDDDDDDICIINPLKQYTVHMSTSTDSVLSDDVENESLAEEKPPVEKEMPAEKELPVLLPEPPSNIPANESLELNFKLSSDHEALSDQGATMLPKMSSNVSSCSDDAKSDVEEASRDTNNELELVKLQVCIVYI